MAGIYIHIPFCKQACRYCDFHFSVSLNKKNELIDCIIKEIEQRSNFFSDQSETEIDTIYFGGGTPSLLNAEELQSILSVVRANFKVSTKAEITLETNPDDVNFEKAVSWLKSGINRMSMGIQSFDDVELKWMLRSHHSAQALQAVKDTIDAGFKNISIDLIYGSQMLSDEQWKKNFDIAFSLNVQHLSCYAMTVEGKNLLAREVENGIIKNTDDEKAFRHFEMLMQAADENNFQHYEISNFCKPGFESRHNTSYWKNIPYLGVGPSAHSYNGKERFKNIASNSVYIQKINSGEIFYEKETLNDKDRYNEYIMVSLRTSMGCNLKKIENDFGKDTSHHFRNEVSSLISNGDVTELDSVFTLTKQGKHKADGIAASLFL